MNNQDHNESVNQDELEIDFAFQDKDVKSMIKKAKRTTIIRNTIISVVVTPILLFAGIVLNSTLVNHQHYKAFGDLEYHERISGPNVFLGSSSFDYGFLGGTFSSEKFKVIEDRVIPWGNETVEFNIFGKANPTASDRGSAQINEKIGPPQVDRFFHYESGERVMLFYHPYLNYDHYLVDFDLLNQVSEDKYIEMALSLDQGYTIDEINTMIPDSVDVTWYRVNSYSQSQLDLFKDGENRPDLAQTVYGFDAYFDSTFKESKRTEEDFVEDVKRLKDSKYNNFFTFYVKDVLYDAIQENKEDGLIIGIVVTGTKDELQVLNGLPFIKGAVLGATVDKY
ncbi:anti sigma factor C-terminal domain-containing protein [Bacillus salitolerans]|uniref:Anti sigma factor C-terminal domain-containing protein n=1 Tax=Bacillus salitolerans TaxID=1437434 RepID=A0ABW4LXB2_9BACI